MNRSTLLCLLAWWLFAVGGASVEAADWPGEPPGEVASGWPEASGPVAGQPEAGYDLPAASAGNEPVYSTLPPPPGWTAAEFARLASKPLAEPLVPGDETTLETGRIADHKDGFFQKLAFSAAWLNRTSEQNMGLTELRSRLTVALPVPSRDFPLLITPAFNVTALNGPNGRFAAPDLPAQLYDVSLELMWLPKLSDRWMGILAVAPGLYSDWDQLQDDALRTKVTALARYDWIAQRLQLVAGLLYLDRQDVNWLPAGGLIWTPHEDARYELLFPRPKLARAIARSELHEDWVYVAGEFGGDTWSFHRPAGGFDRLTIRDWRVYLGIERKRDGGAGHRLEVGYVFSRDIRFDSPRPDYQIGDTLMLRAGIDF
jgi:hypothetical protein